MTLQVYNTLTARKEKLEPLEPGRVRIYSCGPTTYNFFHIGNARSFVLPDLLKRFLRFRGLDTLHVQNLTDIDDKIIQRSLELGVPFERVAERYAETYFQDMARLGCLPPDVSPRASHHVPQIIALIQRLIERGYAYPAGGDVFFQVSQFERYGQLSKQTVEELVAGARVEVNERKRHPADFALWKEAKPGEPAWDSPWGRGRPGWHIECSAMSMTYLGETFDIHTGGSDLVFPHHENEIAQSEAATGRPFVRYWMHVGYINIDGEKMSKSKGNFVLVREIFREIAPPAVRLFLISKHYRSPIEFSEEELRSTERAWRRLAGVKERLDEALARAGIDPLPHRERLAMATWREEAPRRGLPAEAELASRAQLPPGAGAVEGAAALAQEAQTAWERFGQAMSDDLNSAIAVGTLFDLARAINRYLSEGGNEAARIGSGALLLADGVYHRLADVLGLNLDAGSAAASGSASADVVEGLIDTIVSVRNEARQAKNYALADRLRDRLGALGIRLEDGPQGTKWSWG